MIRAATLVAVFALGACDRTAEASKATCLLAYSKLSSEVANARASAEEGNVAMATFHAEMAQMNQSILFERKCCRFDDTCLTAVD